MNPSVPATHPQSYAIIQGNQAPIFTTAAPSPAPPAPVQQQGQSSGAGGDVHICGTCGAHFTEIKEFVGHKQQGCQASGMVGAPGNVSGPQLSSPTQVHQAQPAHTSLMGVPVGMPHVILQTASGPPQMYRIVLEPSIPNSSNPTMHTSTPILAQALSGSPVAQLSHSLGQHNPLQNPSHQPTHQQQDVTTNQMVNTNPPSTCGSAGTLLQLAHVGGDTWHTASGVATTVSPTTAVESQATAVNRTSNRDLVGGFGRSEESRGEGLASRTPTDTVTGMDGNDGGNSAANSMHTEEEDVATFLATQLASQAAPPQTTAVSSQHLISNVVTGVAGEGQVHYTAAPTQAHQPHHIMGLHHHQMEGYGEGPRRPGPNRRLSKTVSVEEAAQANVMETKVATNPKEVVLVHDGIKREKLCPKLCPVKDCGFRTTSNKDLSRHIRKHTGEKPYPCEECGACFSRGDKLKVHRRIHSNSRPYACDVPGCQYRAIDSGSLRKHKRTHTNERPYKCQLCSYSARDGSQLTVHLRTHTGDTPFQCMVENCSAAFKTSSDLRRHERLHTGVKPYKCTACDYACAIKSNLTVHMRLNHFQGAKFSCTKCDFLANNRKQLKEHEKSHANMLIPCELCEYVSTSQTGLRQHMLIHSQEKPFQCRYCSFTCKTTGNLRYHMRNKHGCDVAGRKRGSMSGVRGRAVVGGTSGRRARPTCYRSFKCEECGSGFVREDSYRSHMRQHEKHKIAQSITGKMEPDVFSVVVQDESLVNVEEASSGRDAGANGVGAFQTMQRMGDPLQPGSLAQASVTGSGTGQGSDGAVNGYSSYVITIDGISTVFPNPVRLAGPTVNPGTGGEQLPGTVEVITGNLITPDAKGAPQPPPYDLETENKVEATHHGYDLPHETKVKGQPVYTMAPDEKPCHTSFTHGEVQNHSGAAEFMPHTRPGEELQQVVLVQHHQQSMDNNLEHSIQVHNLSGKPTKTEEV